MFYLKIKFGENLIMKNRFLIVFLLTMSQMLLSAQNVDDYLDNYLGKNKDGYVQPVSDILTGMFNSGLITEPKIDSHFYVKIGIVGSAAWVTDNLKTFSASTEDPFSPEQKTKVSTILGPAEVTAVTDSNGLTYTFPAGINAKWVPFALPQITIGGVLNSELNLRFLAINFGEDFGKLQIIGAALRHDIGHYFNLINYNVNAGYSFQSIKLGSRVNLTNHLISLDAGRDFKHFYYYGRIAYQLGNMDVTYTPDAEEGGNKIEFKNKNDFPLFFGLGGGVKLGKVFRFNLGISYAKFPMAESGIILKF